MTEPKALQIAVENHVFDLFQRCCGGILLKISDTDEVLKVGHAAVMDGLTHDEVTQKMQTFARSKRASWDTVTPSIALR